MGLKVLAGVLLILAFWIAVGFVVVALDGPFKPSGRMVDIGGRRLRLVCQGPARSKDPTVWMEAGAWGFAADFAAVQQRLAARGIRSCAYDRAGLGFSDPGPRPRDSEAIASDLEKLIAASGEQGPFVLMAHSMGGLHVRVFAGLHPEQVAGLVLLEAMTPQMNRSPRVLGFFRRIEVVARVGAVANTLGLTRLFYHLGDRIGLPAQGSAEKKHGFVGGRHGRVAAQELLLWRKDAEEAARVPLDPNWPVAVITAGDPDRFPGFADIRRAPAEASRAGYFENDPAAQHATLLGEAHAQTVMHGVEHVMAALTPPKA